MKLSSISICSADLIQAWLERFVPVPALVPSKSNPYRKVTAESPNSRIERQSALQFLTKQCIQPWDLGLQPATTLNDWAITGYFNSKPANVAHNALFALCSIVFLPFLLSSVENKSKTPIRYYSCSEFFSLMSKGRLCTNRQSHNDWFVAWSLVAE